MSIFDAMKQNEDWICHKSIDHLHAVNPNGKNKQQLNITLGKETSINFLCD